MQTAQIGVYGLGVMGSALALNLAEHGFRVAVTNREIDWIDPFLREAGPLASRFQPAGDLKTFVSALTLPRVVLFMIPSGAPLDAMLAEIAPLLAPGDTIIDAGNADFNDTRRRAEDLAGQGLNFVGMGVSGGAEGARHGPSLMVGGNAAAWDRLAPILTAIAARYGDDPCVAHLGPDGAGHFVKTVHNGIEYADMQMIAGIYGLLRDGAGWGAARIAALFGDWATGPLESFLIEITSRALAAVDPGSGRPLVDLVLDRAGQKGTGRWTVIEALKLGESASAIEAAVGARAWSSDKALREVAAEKLAGAAPGAAIPEPDVLARAMLAGRILSHAQGFQVLRAASDEFGWSLDLARIAEIWRAGCIIRSALLDEIATALRAGSGAAPMILAPRMRAQLAATIGDLRQVVAAATLAGLPVPSLSAALAWHDSLRQGRGTANLIQAQRDLFGAHGYQRIDRPGDFHGGWDGEPGEKR